MDAASERSECLEDIVRSLDGKTPKGTVWKSYFKSVTKFVKQTKSLRDRAISAFDQDPESYTSMATQLAAQYTYSSAQLPVISQKALLVPGAKHDARARQLAASILTQAGQVAQLAASCPQLEAAHIVDTPARRQCIEHLVQAHALYTPGECLASTLAVLDPLLHLSSLAREAGCEVLALFHSIQFERHRAWGTAAPQTDTKAQLQHAAAVYDALVVDPRLACARGMSGPRLAQGVHILIEQEHGAGQGKGQERRGELGRQVGVCAKLGLRPQLPYVGPPTFSAESLLPTASAGSAGGVGASAGSVSQPLSLGKSDSTERRTADAAATRPPLSRCSAWRQYTLRMDGFVPSGSSGIGSGTQGGAVHQPPPGPGCAHTRVLALPYALQAQRHAASAATAVDPRRVLTSHVLCGVLWVMHKDSDSAGDAEHDCMPSTTANTVSVINEIVMDVRRLLHVWPSCLSPNMRAVPPAAHLSSEGSLAGHDRAQDLVSLSPLWLVRLMAMLASRHTESAGKGRLCLLLLLQLTLRLAQACKRWRVQGSKGEVDCIPFACIALCTGLRLLAQCVSQEDRSSWCGPLPVPAHEHTHTRGKRQRAAMESSASGEEGNITGSIRWAGRHLLSNCSALLEESKAEMSPLQAVSSSSGSGGTGAGAGAQAPDNVTYIEDAVLTGWSAHLPPAAPSPLWLPASMSPSLLSALVSCELHAMTGHLQGEGDAIRGAGGLDKEQVRGRWARIQEATVELRGSSG